MRSAAAAFLFTILAACGGDKAPAADAGKPAADAGKAPASDPKAAEDTAIAKADEPPGEGDASPTGEAPIDEGAEPEATATDATATDAKAEGKGDTGAAAEGEGGESGAEEPAPADPKALLTEAKSKKTKDDRALAALAEAEAAGAEPKDLAKAANARGLALHATPDRAKQFFQWALDKDPKAADPAFNLAKQAVVTGELDETKKWLEETKKRGGKKLLAQVEYDPMWEIVKDDPDVKALLQK